MRHILTTTTVTALRACSTSKIHQPSRRTTVALLLGPQLLSCFQMSRYKGEREGVAVSELIPERCSDVLKRNPLQQWSNR